MAKARKKKQRYPVLQKLKGRLIEYKLRYEDACKMLGLTKAWFCLKMNGFATFNTAEIRQLADVLLIPDTEIAAYFVPEGKEFKAVRSGS